MDDFKQFMKPKYKGFRGNGEWQRVMICKNCIEVLCPVILPIIYDEKGKINAWTTRDRRELCVSCGSNLVFQKSSTNKITWDTKKIDIVTGRHISTSLWYNPLTWGTGYWELNMDSLLHTSLHRSMLARSRPCM